MIFDMTRRSGGGGGPSASDAILLVTVPVGSTVTATKGGVTLTPTMWVQAADSTLETALFVIAPTLFDAQNAWTVTATLGTNTASDTVTIDAAEQYALVISYVRYLILNGVTGSGLTIANQRSASNLTTGEDSYGGYVNLHSAAAANTYDTAAFTTTIDVSSYAYLVFRGMARGFYNNNNGCPAYGLLNTIASGSSSSTWYAKTMLRTSGGGTLPAAPEVFTLDISQFSGSYLIGFQEAGSGGNSWQGDVRCYDLYLTNTAPTS